MAALAGYVKNSLEKKRYTLDYACWLDEGETLVDFGIVITPATTPPLVADGAYGNPENTRITVYLSKGNPGGVYTVAFIATTSQGQVKRDDLSMRVT
jgi:hypothetical protein